jgi:NNP family nitrate/nitrite transporter-like MFS transporter
MMALFSLGIGATVGVYTMLPLFLVSERGMETSSANLLLSASRLTGLGAAFVSGMAVDRLGPVKALWAVMGITGLFTIALGLLPGAGLTIALFLQPLVAVCFFPAGFAALALVGNSSARGLAVSFTVPAAFLLGGGGLPTLIGYLGQTFSLAWGLTVSGGIMLLALLLLPALKLRREEESQGR